MSKLMHPTNITTSMQGASAGLGASMVERSCVVERSSVVEESTVVERFSVAGAGEESTQP